MAAGNKVRCNMYLNKENVELVKKFIKGTGLTLSSYIDLFIGMAAQNIDIFIDECHGEIFKEVDGEQYLDIHTAYKVLGIFDMGGVPLSDKQAKDIVSRKIKICSTGVDND